MPSIKNEQNAPFFEFIKNIRFKAMREKSVVGNRVCVYTLDSVQGAFIVYESSPNTYSLYEMHGEALELMYRTDDANDFVEWFCEPFNELILTDNQAAII